MKRSYKTMTVLCLSIMLVLSACSNSSKTSSSSSPAAGDTTTAPTATAVPQKEIDVKLPYYKVGGNVGAKFFLPQLDRFNKKYAGKYKIEIEEVPQDGYNDKMATLIKAGTPPFMVQGANADFWDNVVIPNKEFVDLKPWLDSKPDLLKTMSQASIAYNTVDGQIASLPLIQVRPIGLFYNKEMFQKAGITKSPAEMTFSEFDQALDALKKAGFTPLTMMTGENAWTTMLLASSFFANEPGGAAILQKSTKDKVYDYTDPLWVNTFAEIQKWFKNYTTPNAIGSAYADAANNFMHEKTAIIANGPWMIGDFSDPTKANPGFDKKVGTSLYPGGVSLENDEGAYWWIPKGVKPEEQQVALAFFDFISQPEEIEAVIVAEGGNAPNLKFPADFNSQLSPLLAEFNDSISNNLKVTTKTFADIWPSQIANKEFGAALPLLVTGKQTPEKFAEQLTKAAAEFKN